MTTRDQVALLGRDASNTKHKTKVAVDIMRALGMAPEYVTLVVVRLKGLRLRDDADQPKIGYPYRHHHPRHSGSGSGNPGQIVDIVDIVWKREILH